MKPEREREKSCKKEGRARGFRALGELSSEKVVRERASEEAHLGETLREMRGRATSRVGSRRKAWQRAGASWPVPGTAGRPGAQRRECQGMKSER